MPDRRHFVSTMFAAGVAAPVLNSLAVRRVAEAAQIAGQRAPLAVSEDEAYWAAIRRAFTLDDTLINLNNGWSSPAPAHALEQMIRDMRFTNELPVEHMARLLEPRIESVREGLARDFGCDPEEMAITRNASESNLTVIHGFGPMGPGAEVLVTTQNYGRMMNGWRQRALREGIVIKEIKLDTPPKSDEDVVRAFEAAITPNTRIIEVMHISFMTGYIAPVRKIAEMAKRRGVAVTVDGAHAYAHFPFTRDELGPIDGLAVLAGNDNTFLRVLEFGGAGGITVASHVVGDQMREMWDAAQGGDLERAAAIDAELTPVYEGLSVTTNPIPIKAALEMLGLAPGRMRLPLVPVDAEQRATVRAALEGIGLPVAS